MNPSPLHASAAGTAKRGSPLVRSTRGLGGLRVLGGLALLAVLILSGLVRAQDQTPGGAPAAATDEVRPAGVRFTTVDIFVDSASQPLAAYQLEFKAESGDVKVVGIEGGEHRAFKVPPYYDPAALMKGRVVVAAFDTGKDLPSGRTRVATLHLRVGAGAAPRYGVNLTVAASPEGKAIAAEAEVR